MPFACLVYVLRKFYFWPWGSRHNLIHSFVIFLQLTITLSKEDVDPEKNQHHKYCYAGGLVEYVRWLNTDKVCPTFSVSCRDVFSFRVLILFSSYKTLENIRLITPVYATSSSIHPPFVPSNIKFATSHNYFVYSISYIWMIFWSLFDVWTNWLILY